MQNNVALIQIVSYNILIDNVIQSLIYKFFKYFINIG